MNVIQHLPGNLSYDNTDPDNWEWEAEYRARWDLADENWQVFNAKWYGATESQSASLVDPKSPSLSLEPLDLSFDPSISSSIVVRKSYMTIFDTVWERAISLKGDRGAIITGQPGNGKTLFSYYLLVRLLKRKQVVLFSPDGETMFLFYFNKVYTAPLTTRGIDRSLPEPISSSNVFIWSLFDIHERIEPKLFMVTPPCLPVQTTSPNPIRYRTWDKERRPLLIGLPLWTREELAQGLQYQNRYRSLLDTLCKVYGSSPPNPSDPLDFYPGARALFEEHYNEEDAMQPSPEDALEYLLDAAIDRFGYAARDVFGAVFDYLAMTERHEYALNIEYTELRDAVSALSPHRTADDTICGWIFALSPVSRGPFARVRWHVDFKSDWVAKCVIRALGEEEEIAIRQQIRLFRSIPQAQALAGRLLEPLIHRYIANATEGIWPLINMDSNGVDPPQFVLVQDPPASNNVQFIKVERKIVKLQSNTDLSTHLEDNSYYIPEDLNFPFDAFTIELDRAKNSAILWVFQVTTSRIHGSSTRGYRKIRDIIAILKDELQDVPPLKKRKTAGGHATSIPLVQVRYVLVVPKDESQSRDLQWQFPKGWNEDWKKNDHRGDVYCLRVPLALEDDKAERVR